MRLSLGLSQDVRVEQRLGQSLCLRLTHEQRLELSCYLFGARMELIQSLREEQYEPRATCPHCTRRLEAPEIIAGFNDDPRDFTTQCPKCRTRFEPRLICFAEGGNLELPFYCSQQILAQLPGKEALAPEEFSRLHPAIYRSTIVHHGGIRKAFGLVGLPYPFEEVDDWRHKIRPFLGRLPDTVIAGCAGVSAATIRAIRRKAGIRRFTRAAAFARMQKKAGRRRR